ncbi:hypothetical protein RhiirA1_473797 [Rhizophagus irregularis]|uniref:Protein kinase domain-containing protein n=1 Tax=Rhizophagus irregularis TaxID=588596 RepID=A0A2N0QZU0_9GLOM|nr:hypothetical protein RhiirA1_473797 [Rhizophagus irregularis]CAB4482672.1 unnamed protein product [Rhizophagus irregularis]
MELITIEEPEKGSTYTQVSWDVHRPNAMLQEICRLDYKLDNTRPGYLIYYNINDKNAKGVSCFVPLRRPHNTPNKSLSNENIHCYFIPQGTSLPEGLALFYTHKMKLRFPSDVQGALHFVIAPTISMTKENYEQLIRNLDWQICNLKASAEMNELISLDDDLDGVEDFRMKELYWLMEIWYMQTTYAMDRLHANDIHTWIALDKPSFDDLIQHESRAYIVFSALSCMNARTPASHVTELTYLSDILGELEDAFGWKSTELYEVGMGDVGSKKNKKDDFAENLNYSVPFAKFLPLINDIVNSYNEIIELVEAAEYNKRTCKILQKRVRVVESAIQDLRGEREDRKDFFNSINYIHLQDLFDIITRIKKFILEISQMKSLIKYIKAKSIEKTFKKLCKELDDCVNVFSFSIEIEIIDEFEQLKADQDDLFKYLQEMMVGISADVKDIGDDTKEIDKNLSNQFFSTVVMVNAMNNTMENFMNYQTKIDSIFQVHPLKLSDYIQDKPRKNGRVIKWYNIKNYEEFAFKIILGKKDEKIIQNQVTILKELHDCQNIIKYYGFTRDENKWYLVTEWAEYGNLREFYTHFKKLFDLRLKLRMSLDIARGLNFLRTVEILHRDIRAENILITFDKTAKLANFKLNRFSVAKSKNLERARYCAPELLEKLPNKYDYKCEVYSFGILLWEIAEEKTPYQDINDIQEIADKVRNKLYREPFSENNQMPEEFKQLEIEAVDQDPDFRPKITKMFEVLRNCVKDHSSGSSSSNLSKKPSALKSTPKRTYIINQDSYAPPINLSSLKYMTLADAAKQHKMYKYGKLTGDVKTAYECFETYADLDKTSITTRSNQIKAKYYKAFYISGGLVKSPPNKDKIVAKLFKEVADDEADELPDAKVRYGDCLYNGKGVEKNVSEALKYFEKAAEDGHKVAMYNVGNMYYNGIGCTKDIEKAKYYMKLAAYSDYEPAITFYKTHNL